MRAKLFHSTVLASASILLATTAADARTAPTLATADGRPNVSWHAKTLQGQLESLRKQGGVGVVESVQSREGQWSGAAGVRTIGGEAAQPGDKVRIGSVTKPMVATIMMQLVEEKRISLHTRVDDVLPGLLAGQDKKVTLEHLLSHRSGAPDYLTVMYQRGIIGVRSTQASRAFSDRELVRQAMSARWLFTPGSQSSYSNTNYIVAGLLAEKLTGRSIEELVRTRIFERAGMQDSGFPTGTEFPTPHLTEYTNSGPGWRQLTHHASQFGPAGAIISTTQDLNRFWRALFTGQLVKPGTVNTMVRARGRLGKVVPYGLGIAQFTGRCGTRAEPLYGHDGTSLGTFTLSLSTRDGRAQSSAALTGRLYTADAVKKQAQPIMAVIPSMQYACSD